MSRLVLILVANFLFVDYGVSPDENDKSVYVIQIEPEVAKELVNGYVIESAIPPELKGIRKFRVQVGTEKLDELVPIPVELTSEENQASGKSSVERNATANEAYVQTRSENAVESIDNDTFPLRIDSEQPEDTPIPSLIPDAVKNVDLPGTPLIIDQTAKETPDGLEPDPTPLPQLSLTASSDEKPVRVKDSPVKSVTGSKLGQVVVPIFDEVKPAIIDATEKEDRGGESVEDLLTNLELEDRIVLESLPDVVVRHNEDTVSVNNVEGEPNLLKDNSSDFIRLASTGSSSEIVTTSPTPVEGSRSWPLFSITLLGLIVSLGGNVYLGITVIGFYRKR